MIDDNNKAKSMVLPKWLEYHRVIHTKELTIPRTEPFQVNSFTKNQVKKQLQDFAADPSVFKAADLMGAAIIINDLETATEMAKYVLKHSGVEVPTLELAEKVLNAEMESNINSTLLPINNRIAHLKKEVIKHPHNGISWMELARCYTIKGQKEKARKAVIIALTLSPRNRYVVRSGVRYFTHIDDFDAAYHHLKRALDQVTDPWIKALEVSISLRINIKLGRSKKLLPSNLPLDRIFHFSELFESVGMLELESGNVKNAKKNFKVAWQNPSESVIRHGEWVLRNRLPTLQPNNVLNYENSREAMAWNNFSNLKLEEALENVVEWELEEPYSASPYVLGCHIADCLEELDTAVDFALRGLSANPNHFMLTNNLCYTLTKQNELDKAKERLMSLSSNLTENEMLFYNATSGLYEFKKGNVEIGRKLYNRSFKRCKEIGDQRLLSRAVLNLALAETEGRTENHVAIADSALKASKPHADDPVVYLLRKKLQNLINMRSSQQ